MVLPPYAACLRLVAVAGEHWETIDGEAAAKGFDPFELNIQRFFNYLLFWCLSHIEKERDREQFLYRLDSPLPGRTRRPSEAEQQKDLESFKQFAAMFGA